jgi:hypothetical protein
MTSHAIRLAPSLLLLASMLGMSTSSQTAFVGLPAERPASREAATNGPASRRVELSRPIRVISSI